MDLHVARLADAEGAVAGLVFDGRVPPTVEVKNVVGGGKVKAGAARLERQNEKARGIGERSGIEELSPRNWAG